MSSEGSVSRWIDQLKAGDREAVGPLWERYFRRLVGLARKKLLDTPRRAADEEDVALSVLDSFCRRVERGNFPDLHGRDELWQLLVAITARKACNVVREERSQKRGGGAVRGESALLGPGHPGESARGFEQFAGDEPTPEFAAQMADESRRLLDLLHDDDLRSIALWKMEGDTNEEIAAKLKRAVRTVERKLLVIRGLWEKELPP